MATRPPTAGEAAAGVYEYFRPASEWKQEEGADIFLVHLPGFVREQLKFTAFTNDEVRVIRIRGERPLGANKWSCFRETFLIPQDYEIEKLYAKFEDEKLSVSIPKNIIAQVDPKDEVKATQGAAPSTQTASGSMSKKAQEDTAPIASSIASNGEEKDGKRFPSSSPQKALSEQKPSEVEDDTLSQATSIVGGEKQTEEKSAKLTRAENGPQNDVKEKERSQKNEKLVESKEPENAIEKALEKEKDSSKNRKESTKADEGVPECEKKDEGKSDRSFDANKYSNAAKVGRILRSGRAKIDSCWRMWVWLS